MRIESTKNDGPQDPHARDLKVVREVQAGNKDQFRMLVEKHQERIFVMVLRQVGNRAIAEELTQEIFIKAYLNLPKFKFKARFSTWLIRIALNHVSSYFVSKRYKQSIRSESFDSKDHPMNTDSPEVLIEKKEQIKIFQKALGNLKPVLRDVVTLVSLDGKNYEAAASILDIPVGTVRSRLNKARLELKQYIQMESFVGGSS